MVQVRSTEVQTASSFTTSAAQGLYTPEDLRNWTKNCNHKSKKKDYVLLRLTLRFGVIVVEVLFPLHAGELTHILNKHVFFVVTAEPVRTEQEWKEWKGILLMALHASVNT